MEFGQKNLFREIDLFDFTSFFGLDFFKFSGPLWTSFSKIPVIVQCWKFGLQLLMFLAFVNIQISKGWERLTTFQANKRLILNRYRFYDQINFIRFTWTGSPGWYFSWMNCFWSLWPFSSGGKCFLLRCSWGSFGLWRFIGTRICWFLIRRLLFGLFGFLCIVFRLWNFPLKIIKNDNFF